MPAHQLWSWENLLPSVPDDMVLSVVTRRLGCLDCTSRGWVLHGFPLTGNQAELLAQAGFRPNRCGRWGKWCRVLGCWFVDHLNIFSRTQHTHKTFFVKKFFIVIYWEDNLLPFPSLFFPQPSLSLYFSPSPPLSSLVSRRVFFLNLSEESVKERLTQLRVDPISGERSGYTSLFLSCILMAIGFAH